MTRTKEYLQDYRKRVNELLRFAQLDPWTLTNGDREKLEALKDRLFYALYGFKRDPASTWEEFEPIATPEALSEAQRELKKRLDDTSPEAHLFPLKDLRLKLLHTPDDQYAYRFTGKHLPSLIYVMFAWLLFMSELRHQDFKRCEQCQTWFYPRRRPHKGAPTYCSKRCANIIAARNFRKKKKAEAKKRSRQKRR
jgi:hypothetical protein